MEQFGKLFCNGIVYSVTIAGSPNKVVDHVDWLGCIQVLVRNLDSATAKHIECLPGPHSTSLAYVIVVSQ